MKMETYQVMYAVCCCLQLLQHRSAQKQETIVLSKNLSGSQFGWTVDGATIMSEEFYKDKRLSQTIVLRPKHLTDKFMVQFIYLDVGCNDSGSLEICEMNDFPQTCLVPMISRMCGTMKDIFQNSGKHHLTTTEAGRPLEIKWNTGYPSGQHRGFRITVTAIRSFDGNCGSNWKCSDNMCIARDLHCDKVAHCLDVSDEVVNCSNSDLLPSIYKCDNGGGTFPCVSNKWNERWFGVAIPMLIVLVLFLVAFVVKVRNMICRPPEPQGTMPSYIGIWQIRPQRRRRHRSTRSNNHSSDVTSQLSGQTSDPQLQNGSYGDLLCGDSQPGVHTGGRPAAYDPVNMMLMPPPYSPPTYFSQHQYHPPTEGEPPPIYEEFETQHSQCQHLHHQSVHTCDKDTVS